MNVHLPIMTESEMHKVDKAIDNINILSSEIAKKFESGHFEPSDRLRVQKFEKDFVMKMNMYRSLLTNYQDRKASQLSSLRQTFTARRSGLKNNLLNRESKQSDEEESEQAPGIQLQDVNQETLFYEHMIQLKEKELLQVKVKMENALEAQKQVDRIVKEQGEQIDQIQENVDSARSNVKQAEDLLKEGQKHHMSANKKKIIIFVVVGILLMIIIVPIMVKFL